MSLNLLRRQQNQTMSMAILFVLMGTFIYGIYWDKISWLQLLMIGFTIYAMALLAAPLVKKECELLRNDFYRPFVSILVPAKNEEKVIENTILSLSKLQYSRSAHPNFEIIVIDDGSTDGTASILKNCQRKFDMLKIVSRQEGVGNGKSSALNAGLRQARGEVIAVFDADTHVNPDFLLKSIPLLSHEKIVGVQGRVKLYNPNENFVTRLQNDEFLIFNHLTQKGKHILGGVACLGGNGQLVKRDALEEVGGWNEESLTEDFDMTFRLLLHGYEVRYAEHAILWQEAVHTWNHLFRQRLRWGQGLLTALFDFFLPMLSAKMTWAQRTDGILTLTRILLPFWVIQGYLYQMIDFAGRPIFAHSISPIFAAVFTALFFVTMGLAVKNVALGSWLQTAGRVLQYWLYAIIWVMVLPISYVNYFKTYRNISWDKTHHKGIEPVATPMASPALTGN